MAELLPYPEQLDIDLSTKCNLSCSFCHLSFFNPKEVLDLTYENFLKLEPMLSKIKKLTLFSKFEPLMCKDFAKIFNELKNYDIETYFSTNGILLDEKNIDTIINHLDYLTVSITGFNEESYTKHMGKNFYSKLCDNLKLFNEKKKLSKSNKPKLRISTVWMKDTIGDLKAAIDFAAKYNAEEGVQVTYFIAYSQDKIDQIPLTSINNFISHAKDAMEYAKKQSVKLVFQSDDFEENKNKIEDFNHAKCLIPWKRLSLQPNGDVYPCPVAYNPIGNFLSDDIMSIWNGYKLAEFRDRVNTTNNQNVECTRCVHCRHKSINSLDANNFSDINKFFTQMQRK
ncbi:MAG: hypothetical protein RL154_466 [Pseudomonadota bacterium]|jgi:radical SAM protein with 4Fe4S-binding SPASM domain